MPAYLDDLRREGYLVAESQDAPTMTVEEDGRLVMEWEAQRLAILIPDVGALVAGIEEARHREAAALVDDSGLWLDRP
jgi:hypothetical protein